LLFDSLMMRGVLEYNPAARAKPPRLVRESSHTPVFGFEIRSCFGARHGGSLLGFCFVLLLA